MAPSRVDKKPTRKRSRKARTEVSSDEESSSSSDSESSTSPPSKSAKASRIATAPQNTLEAQQPRSPASSPSPSPTPEQQIASKGLEKSSQESFEQFYLSQATREFANDLDKLRSAGDWKGERSIGLIVRALKSGTVTFGEEERERIGAVEK